MAVHTPQQISVIYASEADVLNMALFGMTAKQWQDKNPDKKAISGIKILSFMRSIILLTCR